MQLLQNAVLHVVPCSNPDGALLGLTRTNALGSNLNRAWAAPGVLHAPEVGGILKLMEQSGVDFCLDVHGDEGLPAPVMCCAPAWTPRLKELQLRFYAKLAAVNQHFSVEGSLPHMLLSPPVQEEALDSNCGDRMDNMQSEGANLTLCSTQVGARFDCLAMTLEQCFMQPWSPSKSMALGSDLIPPLVDILPHLR
jgi:hypothetical protein